MSKLVYSILVISLLFSACTDDDEGMNDSLSIGHEYFPLQLNQESIYQVDSIQYDDFTGRVDTFRHQRRELVEELIIDEENRASFNVGVYVRADDTSSWSKVKLIRKTRTNRRLEILEDNVVRINLVFPVVDGVEWNTNALNASREEEFVYTAVNTAFELEGVIYDSTLTVEQLDEENLIERMFAEEKYATGRGLIYRREIDIRTSISGEIESGFDASIRLISFQ